MKKLLMLIGLMFLLTISFAAATCTVTFDATTYTAGDTATATMSCSQSNEKSTSYVLTWSDSNAVVIKETDTGTTPSSPGTPFNEDYIIPANWISGNTLSAVMTGSQLEGSDSAIVYSAFEVTATINSPTEDVAILINDSFSLTCNATNTGGGTIIDMYLKPQYSNGTTIGTTGTPLILNETGEYFCGNILEDASCVKTWEITGKEISQEDIMCYAIDTVSDVSSTITINTFSSASEQLTISLDSATYSPGESVTATMTSFFTSAPYNISYYNSTGGLLCSFNGITPTTSLTPFFDSCVLDNNITNQENNTVIYYINGNSVINVSSNFNIGDLSSIDYSITNIRLKYEETFLGYSQSIKGTVIDSFGEIAIGECCRVQIDDATTLAPIYTSEDEYIDGAGSCETHWTLDKNDFEAPQSYSAMIIAWQCSDPSIPSASKKRGTATTSFDVIQYFTEADTFVPVVDNDLFAGFDTAQITQERLNNFGQPMEVIETVWFANIDTEQDYHFDYLQEIKSTVNVGTTYVTESYQIPETLPSGSYRIEKNIFYLYQGEIKEFSFVKSEDFNVTAINEVLEINSLTIKDYFGAEVTTSATLQDNATLPDSNWTDPYYMLQEGFGYQICGNMQNNYDKDIYWHLENLVLVNPTTGQSYQEYDTQSQEAWKRIVPVGTSDICWYSNMPLTVETHSDWKFTFGSYVGTEAEPFVCDTTCVYGGSTNYFYSTAIEDAIQFDKWIEEPTATSVGKPATYIVTAREEYLSMNDDCEYKSQSEILWGSANVTCFDKNDNTTELKIDYDKYPVAGEKFKVCYQIKNYFSDEVALELYDLYIDDDSGETVEYFQGEVTENYVPSITNDKVYVSEEPSRADEQQGILIDGYSNMCSKWITLPTDIKGGNDWDIQGKIRIDTEVYDLEKEVNWRWESDEFPIFGLDDDKTSYITSNTITDASSYKIGDELYVCANVSSTYNDQLDIDVYYNYRCSATQQDDETDRTLFGSWTEIRGINGQASQNQCHKFVIPDDTYIRSQGTVNCYATTTIYNDEVDEETTTSSDFFTISKHTSTINLTPVGDNYNFYINYNPKFEITIDNPLLYKQKPIEAHYMIGLQTENNLIYNSLHEIEFEINEANKTFEVVLDIRDSSEYEGDRRNWDMGEGWAKGAREPFLNSIQTGDDVNVQVLFDYHYHLPEDEGELGSSLTAFSQHFGNYTFKDPGKTDKTYITAIEGGNETDILYPNADGQLEFFVYFNLSSISGPDGTLSTNNRQTWINIVENGEEDSNVLCYSDKPYSYINNETSYDEYWINIKCSVEDTIKMYDKDIRIQRRGTFSSSPYVYDTISIEKPVTIHSLTATSANYVGGEVVYMVTNITGFTERKYNVESVLKQANGLQVHKWESNVDNFYIQEGNNIVTFAYLLPTSLSDSPYNSQDYSIEIALTNLITGKVDVVDSFELGTITAFNPIISENITSTVIDNDNPVTIDYELNIPLKSMDFFPHANQPFRIKYHFIDDGGQAVSQFSTIDGQYAPLEAYAMFPADSQQNFSVTLQPTNLVPGTYTIIEEIQIDPPVDGVAVWETVGEGDVGSFVVTETLVGEPKGLVQTAAQTYDLANNINITTTNTNVLVTEINETTSWIQDNMETYVNVILDEINSSISNLDLSNATVNVDLSSIESLLYNLRVEVDNNADFTDELIFLVTDSLVATQDAKASDDNTVKIEKLEVAHASLTEFKDITLSEEKVENSNIYIQIGIGVLIIIMISLIIMRIKNNKKHKLGVNDNEKKYDRSTSSLNAPASSRNSNG